MNRKVILTLILLASVICLVLVLYAGKDEATSVIAAFTIVLAIATIWNGTVTQGLLDQSRTALLVDMFERTVGYLNSIGSSDVEGAGRYLCRKVLLIGKINEKSKEEFLEDLNFWAAARHKTIPAQAIKRAERLLEEKKIIKGERRKKSPDNIESSI